MFSLGSHTGQITLVLGGVLFGIALVPIGISLVLLAPKEWGIGVVVGIVGAISVLSSLAETCRVYEVELTRADTLRFVTLTGVREISAADTVSIVRSERKSNGALSGIRVVHQPAWALKEESVSLAGREDLFTWLTALAPVATVEVHEYDDTSAD